jgi:molybdate transport system substrate-binding protein
MKKYRFLSILLLLVVVLAACDPAAAITPAAAPAAATETAAAAQPVTLTIFAASSLTAAFTDLGKAFEAAHPGATVQFNFAGSQDLATQLTNGAPADVFASANQKQLDVAVTAGRIDKGVSQIFVKNRLVVVVPTANPAKLAELKDLAKPGLKLVLADKSVPVGQYALDFLTKASKDTSFGATFQADVLKNVVSYEQNVKAVLTKVSLGEADAGIVYTTDITADVKDKVTKLDIPDALNTVASYPIAVVKDSKNADLAKAFVDFVLSADGQAVLAKYGFITVK